MSVLQPGYERVTDRVGEDLEDLMARVQAFPEIPMAPHSDTPILRQSFEQLLREADGGRRRAQTRRTTVP